MVQDTVFAINIAPCSFDTVFAIISYQLRSTAFAYGAMA